MEYKLLKNGSVLRLADQAFIPPDPENCDFQEYTAWCSCGNIPEPAESIVEIKARVWEAIKNERDSRADNGGFQVDSNWFHSDQKSRSQQLSLVLLGTKVPTNLQWKTMDGSFVTMTAALAQQIIEASRISDQAVFDAAEKHKVTMDVCADPANYEFSFRWPKMFGE